MPAVPQYVLIDYENVQPKNLALLSGHPFKVIVFLGANQGRIPSEFAEALQARGDNGGYFRIHSSGRNALDFHIAYHLGQLAAAEPTARFEIVTKDTDLDPLIGHMRSRGIAVQRCTDLASIVPVPDERIHAVLERLSGQGTRPGKKKGLTKTIASWFKALEQVQVEAVVAELESRGKIAVTDGKVTYNLP